MTKHPFRNEIQLRWRLAGITYRLAELVPFRAAWAARGAAYRAYERAAGINRARMTELSR